MYELFGRDHQLSTVSTEELTDQDYLLQEQLFLALEVSLLLELVNLHKYEIVLWSTGLFEIFSPYVAKHFTL